MKQRWLSIRGNKCVMCVKRVIETQIRRLRDRDRIEKEVI